MRIIFIAIVVIFVFVVPVFANVPLFPVVMLAGFSFMMAIRNLGVFFAAVVFLESYVLWKRENLNFFESAKLSFLANLFSTLIGIGIASTYSSSMLMFVGVPLGAWAFASMLTALSKESGHFKMLTSKKGLCYGAFFVLGVIAFILGYLTIPGHTYSPERSHFINSSEVAVAMVAAAGLFLIGFILSFISEAYVIVGKISKKSSTIVFTVLLMNICSYIFLLLSSYSILRNTISEKSWFYHPPRLRQIEQKEKIVP